MSDLFFTRRYIWGSELLIIVISVTYKGSIPTALFELTLPPSVTGETSQRRLIKITITQKDCEEHPVPVNYLLHKVDCIV